MNMKLLYTTLMMTTILASSVVMAIDSDDEARPPSPPPQRPDDVVRVEEFPGRYEYDGNIVYAGQSQVEHLRNGERRTTYSRTGNLRGHEGNDVVHVDVFDIGNGMPAQLIGHYDFSGDLEEQDHWSHRTDGRVVYSDGDGGYFYPRQTQEKWKREGRHYGAFIASYNEALHRLHFLNDTRILHQGAPLAGDLPRGLFHIVNVDENGPHRTETWRALVNGEAGVEEANHSYSVLSPFGAAPIPGMSSTAPRVVPVDAGSEQAARLQSRLQDTDAGLRDLFLHPEAEGSVVVLGSTGTGKSTLLYLLARRQLNARRGARGLRLVAEGANQIPVFNIGEGHGTGTRSIAVWYDLDHNRYLVDCPGFGDVAGGEADILHAYSILRLLKSRKNFKIIFTLRESDIANRTKILQDSLNQLTGFFRDETSLNNSISLVVTQQRDADVALLLQELNEEFTEDDADFQLTDESRRLLSFFATNPDRVATIPYPGGVGVFGAPAALAALEKTLEGDYVHHSANHLGVDLSAEAIVLVTALGNSLNEYIRSYIHTEGTQRVLEKVKSMVRSHTGSLQELRDELNATANFFERLGREPAFTGADFIQAVGNYIDIDAIENTIGQIRFLNQIGADIALRLTDWTQAFAGVIDRIKLFAQSPEVIVGEDGTYTIRGHIVGLSDVQRALDEHETDHVRVFSWNHFFADQGIIANGKSFSIIAPRWKVNPLQEITIDLSGLDGAHGLPGVDGEPGQPGGGGQPGIAGQNGGNFYGKGFYILNPKNLRLISNGGNGGNGGSGGRGADGNNEVYAPPEDGPAMDYYSGSFKIGGTPARRISKIVIRCAAAVDSIELFACAGLEEFMRLGKAGGNGGSRHEVQLAYNEYLMRISGQNTGDRLTNFILYTNLNTYGPFGCERWGSAFNFTAPQGEAITSIMGNLGRIDKGKILVVLNISGAVYSDGFSAMRTDGSVGGKGGLSGAGGQSGAIELSVSNCKSNLNEGDEINIINIASEGSRGNHGSGGQGGNNGKIHAGPERGSAPDGISPTDLSEAKPAAPVVPLDTVQTAITYSTQYLLKAIDPLSAGFLEEFPGLSRGTTVTDETGAANS